MTARTRRLSLAVAAVAGLLALTGCQAPITISTDATTTDSSEPVSSGAFDANGNLPNPCTLLTPAEVNELTGTEITRIDRDKSTAVDNPYCQWQLEQGVLLLSLSPISADDFEIRPPRAVDVEGLGDAAYTSSGHLFVRSVNVYIDVYSTATGGGAGKPENLAISRQVAERVIAQF